MVQVDPEYYPMRALEPDQELAVAVIMRAFSDLEAFTVLEDHMPKIYSSKNRFGTVERDAKDAAKFFLGSSLDLWCGVAGIKSDIRAIALKRYPQIKKWGMQ